MAALLTSYDLAEAAVSRALQIMASDRQRTGRLKYLSLVNFIAGSYSHRARLAQRVEDDPRTFLTTTNKFRRSLLNGNVEANIKAASSASRRKLAAGGDEATSTALPMWLTLALSREVIAAFLSVATIRSIDEHGV